MVVNQGASVKSPPGEVSDEPPAGRPSDGGPRAEAVLEAALRYARLGWRVIPLHHVKADGSCSCGNTKADHKPGKHPRTPGGLHDATTDEAAIRGWLGESPDANLAVVCDGVVMIGPDGEGGLDDLADLEAELGPLPETVMAYSGKAPGQHHLFKPPADGLGFPNKKNVHGKRIDTRGCKADGSPLGYFLVEPSRNADGPYSWVPSLGPGEVPLAELPEKWLNWLRNGPGKAQAGDDIFEELGRRFDAGYRPEGRPAADGRPSAEERCVAYLAKCDPSISGAGGHDDCYWPARVVVYGFDFGAERGFDILWTHFNHRCAPPWSEKELRHKCEDADTKPFKKPRGWLLTDDGRGGPFPGSSGIPPGGAQGGPSGNGAAGGASPGAGTAGPGGSPRLVTRRLSGVRPRPVRWLVPDRVPLGKLTLLAGDGGHGKSTILITLAADVTMGRPAFGLTYDPPPPSDVILISCEDDAADTVVPRLMAAYADLDRCHEVLGTQSGQGRVMFSLSHFLELEAELEARPEVRLVIIDPAGAYIGSRVDDHKDSQLRALLAPLNELAARRNVAIVLIKHLNKGVNIKAVSRVSGSVGYINAVRSALLVAPDPDDESRKFLLPLKNNLTGRRDGLAYRIATLPPDMAGQLVAGLAGELSEEDRAALAGQMIYAHWLGPASVTADEVLRQPDAKKQAGDLDRAAAWLLDHLKGGPAASKQCVEKGNEALGLNKRLDWWRDKVLKDRLGGRPQKEGFDGGWVFTIPSHYEEQPSST